MSLDWLPTLRPFRWRAGLNEKPAAVSGQEMNPLLYRLFAKDGSQLPCVLIFQSQEASPPAPFAQLEWRLLPQSSHINALCLGVLVRQIRQ